VADVLPVLVVVDQFHRFQQPQVDVAYDEPDVESALVLVPPLGHAFDEVVLVPIWGGIYLCCSYL